MTETIFIPEHDLSEETKDKLVKASEDKTIRIEKSAKERIQEFKEQFEISVEPHKYTGGQMCGIMPSTVIGKHEELGIEIRIKTHTRTHKNRELLQTVFDLVFDELIR